MNSLDNNDGFFYIKIDEERNIEGYCFIRGESSELNTISAKDYMKNYKRTNGFTKKQEKEFVDGLNAFEKLRVIDIPKRIK